MIARPSTIRPMRKTALAIALLAAALVPALGRAPGFADDAVGPLPKTEEIGEKNVGKVDLVRTLEGPTDWARCVAFQPGGTLLAVGSKDGFLRLFDLSTGAPPATIKAAPC